MRSKNQSIPAPASETPIADQALPETEPVSTWGSIMETAKTLAQKAAASKTGQGLIKTTKKLVKKKAAELAQSTASADSEDASVLTTVAGSPLGNAIGSFIQQQLQNTSDDEANLASKAESEDFISEDDSDQIKKLASKKHSTAVTAEDGSNNNAGNAGLLETVRSSSVTKALMKQASSFVQQQAENLVNASNENADNNLQASDEDEEEDVSWEMVEVEIDEENDGQDLNSIVADLSEILAPPKDESESNNNAADQSEDEATDAEASQNYGEKSSLLQTLTDLSQNDMVKSLAKSGATALKEFGPSAVAALSPSEPGQDAKSSFLGKAVAFASHETVQQLAGSSFNTVCKVGPSVAAAVTAPDVGEDTNARIVTALATIATDKTAQKLAKESFAAAKQAVQSSQASAPAKSEEKKDKATTQKDLAMNQQAEIRSEAAEEALWKIIIKAAAADPTLRKAFIFAAESGMSIWVVPKITNVVLSSVIGEAWAETITSTMSNWATYAAFFRAGSKFFPTAPDVQPAAASAVQASSSPDHSKKMN
jgi:hypothetical protein